MALQDFAANDGRVVTAEAKTVVHRDFDFRRSSMNGGVIQIAIRIGRIQVDCWWNNVAIAGENGQYHFDAATRPQGMTKVSLRA